MNKTAVHRILLCDISSETLIKMRQAKFYCELCCFHHYHLFFVVMEDDLQLHVHLSHQEDKTRDIEHVK